MSTKSSDIAIVSLAGGLNDYDSPFTIANDVCTEAENVEFFFSPLGERRLGCVPIGLPTSITADSNIQAVTWMGRHLPTNTLGDAELWVLAQHLTSTNTVLTRRTASTWNTVSPNDAITVTTGLGHKLNAISLHGKFFIAHKSAFDQLHVWDGTTFRKTSLAASAAPTAGDTGGAGALAGIRYYRVRYVVVSGATVQLRGEPSPVLTFPPSGGNASITITKPATISQGETHWELEASTDNANFYRIARTIVATTTVVDTATFATGYSTGTLSESLTSYTQLPSAKFLTTDADRLIMAGSWENPTYASRVWWTPVFGSTGVGNDERLDMTVNPYLDLDGYAGGEITGISKSVNGYLFVFKWSHIYKLSRSGTRFSAYTATPVTTARGALPGSLVEAVDKAGHPAQYFLDPKIGPMRLGAQGLEWCGADIRSTWSRVNLTATTPAHGVFYQSKNQVHFWVAVDGADYPNFKLVLHCDEMTSGPDGAHRGWVTVPVGNRIADAHCSLIFSDNVDSTSNRNQALVPFIGKQQWSVGLNIIKDLVQRCDVGQTDAFSGGDPSTYFYAKLKTKPFTPGTLLNKTGIMSGAIAVKAVSGATNELNINIIRDFGLETVSRTVNFIPSPNNESIVIRGLDNLSIAEATTVQLELGDLDPLSNPSTSWALYRIDLKLRSEQTS